MCMDPQQLNQEAVALLEVGRIPAALNRLQEAVRLAPDDARHWRAMGNGFKVARRWPEAIESLEQAAALDPRSIAARSDLGLLLQHLSQVEPAIHWHGEALALQPDSLVLRLNHAFVLPVVAGSLAEIEACRGRCEQGLADLLEDTTVRLDPGHAVGCHTFSLAYHGRNDRPLLQAYGALLQRHLGGGPQPQRPAGTAAGARRPRLGFLSAYFCNHTNGYAFEGLIRGIDRHRFELVLVHVQGGKRDGLSHRLEAACDRVVTLPRQSAPARAQLRALELDLLFFTDLGMEAFVTDLACVRSAPVQVSGWGIPHTSGLPLIDHYVSSALVEPPEADAHYSETLVRLPGLPCRYLRGNLADPPEGVHFDRQYFLLPEDDLIVGCLQHPQKLHPDLDAVLEALALAVPEALFVVVASEVAEWTQRFLDRIATTAPALAERVLVLAQMDRTEFMGLAGCLDLLLDSLHYGSGITMFETAITGTPTVSLEGPLLRSRLVAAAYRQMGIADAPIASSRQQMVALAAGLLRDGERRRDLAERIRRGAAAHLYDGLEMVRGFEDFAVEAIARAAGSPPGFRGPAPPR